MIRTVALLALLAVPACSDGGPVGKCPPFRGELFLCITGDSGAGDAGCSSDTSSFCNPIAQTGCLATEKCTWIIDQRTPTEVGHIGCVLLNGSEVTVGGVCQEGPPGPRGFDNCVKGAVCATTECKTICDPQQVGAASGCPAMFACSRYSGLFDVCGTIVSGACDPQCDPLNQNLIAGSMAAACASTNPAQPNKGCYTFNFVEFSCAPVDVPTLAKTDRVEPVLSPSGTPFVNGCAPGYVPFFYETTGSMKIVCAGLCASGNISNVVGEAVNATGLPNGSAKLVTQAAPRAGDGNCVAGEKGSASGGPQNCVMLWSFLVNANGDPSTSPYNETVGVCFSHDQFQYDSNNDMTPDKVFPPCETLPKRTAGDIVIDNDAADFGCQTIAESNFDSFNPSLMRDFRLSFASGGEVRR